MFALPQRTKCVQSPILRLKASQSLYHCSEMAFKLPLAAASSAGACHAQPCMAGLACVCLPSSSFDCHAVNAEGASKPTLRPFQSLP
jgi:hypothetical protein